MKYFRFWLLCGILTISMTSKALAWGEAGHNYVNGAATTTLPAGTSLTTFFQANKGYLMAHSSDPDLWHDKNRAEGPHHFINLDAYGTPSGFALMNLPVSRADADKKFGHDFVEKTGTVDWTIARWTETLAEAMKAGNTDRILADAAVLGHYVGDAHVPFHSVLNYNGQLSAQRGVHVRFESDIVNQSIKMTDLSPAPAEVLPDVLGAARSWSAESLDLTPTCFSADIQARAAANAAGKTDAKPDPDGSPSKEYYDNNPVYWKTFISLCRPIALARLNASATHLGDVWLTAWQMAGRPDLSKLKPPTPNVPVPVPDPGAIPAR